MSAATHEEFGPTLPQLLGPRWRRWGAGAKTAVIGAVLLLAIAASFVLPALGGESFSYSGPEAPAFSFKTGDLQQVSPLPNEVVRLEQAADGRLLRSLAAQPVAIPPRPNPIATTLPFAARQVEADAADEHAGYELVAEGRTRLGVVDGREAYMIAFTATGAGPTGDGGMWIGKIFLVPEPGKSPRRAIAVELLERVTDQKVAEAVRRFPAGFLLNWPVRFWVQQRTSVDAPDELERPLKTLEIG